LSAPHFFEGGCTGEGGNKDCKLKWNNPEHRQMGLNTMYNVVALNLVNIEAPLDSKLLIKPLLEGFQPTAIYGPGVDIPVISQGYGKGIYHGGTAKFSFGCHEPFCLTSGVVDCRKEKECVQDSECVDGKSCLGAPHSYCRISDSYCDEAYVHYVRFVEYFAECKPP
jgi:hypothetical protein